MNSYRGLIQSGSFSAILFGAVFSLCSKTSTRNGCSSFMRPSSRSGLTPYQGEPFCFAVRSSQFETRHSRVSSRIIHHSEGEFWRSQKRSRPGPSFIIHPLQRPSGIKKAPNKNKNAQFGFDCPFAPCSAPLPSVMLRMTASSSRGRRSLFVLSKVVKTREARLSNPIRNSAQPSKLYP